jgi:hypothetical protein
MIYYQSYMFPWTRLSSSRTRPNLAHNQTPYSLRNLLPCVLLRNGPHADRTDPYAARAAFIEGGTSVVFVQERLHRLLYDYLWIERSVVHIGCTCLRIGRVYVGTTDRCKSDCQEVPVRLRIRQRSTEPCQYTSMGRTRSKMLSYAATIPNMTNMTNISVLESCPARHGFPPDRGTVACPISNSSVG